MRLGLLRIYSFIKAKGSVSRSYFMLCSYCWIIFLNHLAAHGTSLTRGQVAVVALLQVYANLRSSFHLKTCS